MRRLARHALLACVVALPAVARAAVDEFRWDPALPVARTIELGPRGFAELCGRLDKGGRIAWSFEATRPVDFNIHFHEGDRVVYPVRHDAVTRVSGHVRAEVGQTYCWMWTNRDDAAASVRVELKSLR